MADPSTALPVGAHAPRAERPSEAYGRARVARARAAVSSVFFQQGLIVGGWALHIPIVLDRLAITESTMGLIIVAFGTGAIIAMLSLGPIIERTGSRAATRLTAIVTSFFLPLISITPDVATTAIVAFALGAAIGTVDVSMNAQAVEVERRRRRPIMSSFHAYWSMGTLVGASLSGAIIATVGATAHAALFAAICLAIAAYAWGRLVRERVTSGATRAPFRFPRAPAVWVLGLVCLLAYVPEGAAVDWSALYLQDGVGAPLATAGFALAGLQVTMMAMRFAGDAIRERIGGVATLRYGGLIGAAGFALAGAAGLDWTVGWDPLARMALVTVGFVIAGLGIANIVPVAFAACGSIPGVSTGAALSIVTVQGYAGVLLAPSIVGWVGERTGFAPVFVALGLMTLAIVALAAVVRR